MLLRCDPGLNSFLIIWVTLKSSLILQCSQAESPFLQVLCKYQLLYLVPLRVHSFQITEKSRPCPCNVITSPYTADFSFKYFSLWDCFSPEFLMLFTLFIDLFIFTYLELITVAWPILNTSRNTSFLLPLGWKSLISNHNRALKLVPGRQNKQTQGSYKHSKLLKSSHIHLFSVTLPIPF